MLTCSRCHTVNGVNGVTAKLTNMLGRNPWTTERLSNFIAGMHLTRTYMPPFPGSPAEAEALAIYLQTLQPASTPAQLTAAANSARRSQDE